MNIAYWRKRVKIENPFLKITEMKNDDNDGGMITAI
jgi:hypothetical protein